MIIKIEGLPDGQKIKHINVDISFEDDGSAVVKTKTDTETGIQIDKPKSVVESDIDFEPPKAPEHFHFDDRPQKEVPPEMQDLEF